MGWLLSVGHKGISKPWHSPSGVRNIPVTYCFACCLHFNDSCFVVNHGIFLNFSYSLWSVKSSVRSISDLRLGETMVQALIHQKGAMTQVSLDEHFPWNQQLFSSTASWWLHLHLFAFVSVFIFFTLNKLKSTYSNAKGWIAHDLQKLMPLCNFSKFHFCMNHLAILLRYRLWLSKPMWG